MQNEHYDPEVVVYFLPRAFLSQNKPPNVKSIVRFRMKIKNL